MMSRGQGHVCPSSRILGSRGTLSLSAVMIPTCWDGAEEKGWWSNPAPILENPNIWFPRVSWVQVVYALKSPIQTLIHGYRMDTRHHWGIQYVDIQLDTIYSRLRSL